MVNKVHFGCRDPKGGALLSNIRLQEVRNLNHYPQIEEGILAEECSDILKQFFRNKR